MNQLMTSNQPLTMSSLDFLNNIVNPARVSSGESEVRNNVFIVRVLDECDDLLTYKKLVRGNEMTIADLDQEQMMLVGMRESKAVRKSVLAKIKALAEPVGDPILLMAHRIIELSEQNKQLEATKAEIGQRREATAMNTASQAVKKANKLEVELDKSKEYCTIKRMEMLKHGQKFKWRELKAASVEMELMPTDVFDANYGTVKAYHRDVWLEVYALDF